MFVWCSCPRVPRTTNVLLVENKWLNFLFSVVGRVILQKINEVCNWLEKFMCLCHLLCLVYLVGKRFGTACYFSTTSERSTGSSYSPPNDAGEKFMFMVKVLTGEYCKGSEGLKSPPYKNELEYYDSVVDDVSNPTMFAVFQYESAYPEYIIRFKSK